MLRADEGYYYPNMKTGSLQKPTKVKRKLSVEPRVLLVGSQGFSDLACPGVALA